jgi:hypothetical protein
MMLSLHETLVATVRTPPSHWFWFHRRWKNPKQGQGMGWISKSAFLAVGQWQVVKTSAMARNSRWRRRAAAGPNPPWPGLNLGQPNFHFGDKRPEL